MQQGIKRMLLGLLFILLGIHIATICIAYDKPAYMFLSLVCTFPEMFLVMNGYTRHD